MDVTVYDVLWLKVVQEPDPVSNDGVSAFARVHQLKEQLLSMPDVGKSPTNWTPLETGFTISSYRTEDYSKNVSKKAEEIINKFKKMQVDSSETVHVQLPPTVKQQGEEDTEHVQLPAVSPMGYLPQHQFLLDQV